jgi:hypothetical protein
MSKALKRQKNKSESHPEINAKVVLTLIFGKLEEKEKK